LIKEYQTFLLLYNKLKVNNGDNLILENTALILHRDILNFESESLVNWEIIKTIINKINMIDSRHVDDKY
jgi:hypothetical protein